MREFYSNYRQHGLREALARDYSQTRERHPKLTKLYDAYAACPREAAFSTLMFGLGLTMTAVGLECLIDGDIIGPACAAIEAYPVGFLIFDSGFRAVDRLEIESSRTNH